MRLFTAAETAIYMDIPAFTLRRLRGLGLGPRCQRLGRGYMYDPDDVDAYMWEFESRGKRHFNPDAISYELYPQLKGSM